MKKNRTQTIQIYFLTISAALCLAEFSNLAFATGGNKRDSRADDHDSWTHRQSCFEESFPAAQGNRLDLICVISPESGESSSEIEQAISSNFSDLTQPILWTQDIQSKILNLNHEIAPEDQDAFFRPGAILAVLVLNSNHKQYHGRKMGRLPAWIRTKLNSNPANILIDLSTQLDHQKRKPCSGQRINDSEEFGIDLSQIGATFSKVGYDIDALLEKQLVQKSYSFTPTRPLVDSDTVRVSLDGGSIPFRFDSRTGRIDVDSCDLRSPSLVAITYCTTPTPSPTVTPTPSPTVTPTPSPTVTPTPSPTVTPTPSPTVTPTPSPTVTPTPSPTVTPTPSPTVTPSSTPTCSGLSCGVFGI